MITLDPVVQVRHTGTYTEKCDSDALRKGTFDKKMLTNNPYMTSQINSEYNVAVRISEYLFGAFKMES